MVHRIQIDKGLDIPVAGVPEAVLEAGRPVGSVALLGRDYPGLKPRMLVQEGDSVAAGQALFVDKRDPEVLYTAPGAGRVATINRGARRALQSVVIELAEPDDGDHRLRDVAAGDPAELSVDAVRSALFESGLWTAFRTRPFSKVPRSDSSPRSIFVTAIDTQPLAVDPMRVLAEHGDAFVAGLGVLTRLTEGAVYLCTPADWQGPACEHERVQHVEFSGPHPAGAPGTHIHHLDPVSADRTVWHISYQDVIAIGKLFQDGSLWLQRVVALGGEGFSRPRWVTTRVGASIDELVTGELEPVPPGERSPRLVSGSVLSGRAAAGVESYLGRYHLQVAAIPQQNQSRLFGWSGLFNRNYSFAGLFSRASGHAATLPFSTASNGRTAALIPVEAFERVVPLDILPVPLLRALMIRNTDQAQALGCLELDAEDLALCSFVCPGKNDYGTVLNINLELIERDG